MAKEVISFQDLLNQLTETLREASGKGLEIVANIISDTPVRYLGNDMFEIETED